MWGFSKISFASYLLTAFLCYKAHAEIDTVEIANETAFSDTFDQADYVNPSLIANSTFSEILEHVEDNEKTQSTINEVSHLAISSIAETRYPYEEDLFIKPLTNNYLLTTFSFFMKSQKFSPTSSVRGHNDYSHYTVFPKAFKPLLDRTSTRQLSLRFTRGFWDAESWGRLPHDGFKSGGSGVELWAVIESDSKDNAFEHWKTLANSLSGLFCASINFIDSSRTTYPVESFQPDHHGEEGLPIFDQSKQLYLIRAALANEPICTENLTPFIKLLPTKGKSGFSTLLDGHKVFDSSWHSLSIDITTRCGDKSNSCYYALNLSIDTVINVPNVLARNERPIPKPYSSEQLRCDPSKPYDAFQCFPLPEETRVQYRLSQLYGKTIMGSNLISNQPSRVCVDVTKEWNAFIVVDGEYFATNDNCFDLRESINQDIYLESSDTSSIASIEDAPIYVSRSLTGYGQDRGGLRTVINNPSTEPVTLVYFESLPWFMRVYLSTLKLEVNDPKDEHLTLENVINSTYYVPAADRKRGTHLEYTITVPPKTTFALSYQFDKSLLLYSEYPPDANHGFEIESAVVTVTSPVKYQTRTTTLLLLLSTPDFSMPYNVIILTSTIMGLIFGSLFNLLVKRLVTIEEADRLQSSRGLKSKLNLLRNRFLNKLGRQVK